MAVYTLNDARTRFASQAIAAMGGSWNKIKQVWMFGNPEDLANSLVELYHAIRPTAKQVETLEEMLIDGTAEHAWTDKQIARFNDEGFSFKELDKTEASDLLSAGFAARRVTGYYRQDDAMPRAEDNVPNAHMTAHANRAAKRKDGNGAPDANGDGIIAGGDRETEKMLGVTVLN